MTDRGKQFVYFPWNSYLIFDTSNHFTMLNLFTTFDVYLDIFLPLLSERLSIGHQASNPSFVLVFTGVRRLLFSSSLLVANKRSLRIFNITKMVAKGLQHAVLNGQYWVFKSCSYSPYVPAKATLHSKQKTVQAKISIPKNTNNDSHLKKY